MAEYAASPSCFNLQYLRPRRGFLHLHRFPFFTTLPSKSSLASGKVFWLSTWRNCKLDNPVFSNSKPTPYLRETSLTSTCMWSLADGHSVTPPAWIPVGDQLLLMASIFLAYLAGVIPVRNSTSTSQNNLVNDDALRKTTNSSSGSAGTKCDSDNLKHAWDVVRGKLLDSLDTIERGSDFRNGVLDEQQHVKRPLSLHAVSEGPKIRLLWASLHQLEQEVKYNFGTSDTGTMDDWLIAFSRIIQKSCKPVCFAWLEKELRLETNKMELVSLITETLTGRDNTVLQTIRKSGKENLYAELLYFLRFGALRKGCCYDQSLFTLYGDSILEDLVITLADGIASTYLEVISLDGNLSDEVNGLGLAICNLSTRALQRLRNEVALNRWLYQNLEAIVSMYEDRVDLYTLKSQLIEEKSSDFAETYSWWKKLTVRKYESMSVASHYVVISHFSLSVKRTKELRALTGWRYYFSLFLEFSDISMPMFRAIIDKVSNAISFFLVCLIGRSLGLIYTGIRQSLRWK